jgi:hypothetical protein
LESLVEQIIQIYKKKPQKRGAKIATAADVASKLVSSDVRDIQLDLLNACMNTISALESAGKTKDDLI